MTFIKTSLLSGAATSLTILLSFVLNKVLAVYVGPAGFALVGQFQNFLSILQLWATGGVTTGTVKYTAEFRTDLKQKHAFWSMAIRISFLLSTICAVLLLVFANEISIWFLKTDAYTFIFQLSAIVVFFIVVNQFLLSVLNGQKEIGRLLLLKVLTALVQVTLVWWLVQAYGVLGALEGLIFTQAVVFIVTFYLVYQRDWFSWSFFVGKYDSTKVRLLLGFTLMSVVGGITAPVSQLFVRDYIGETISWDSAGQIQALWYLSDGFLAILVSVLTVYFLPRFSEIQCGRELRSEVLMALKVIVPALVAAAFIVIMFRNEIVLLIYTEEFLPMADLFVVQFIGNVIKGVAMLFGFIMLAKSMTKSFVITQLLFATTFTLLSFVLVREHGFEGAAEAYALNYLLYCIAVVFIFMKATKSLLVPKREP